MASASGLLNSRPLRAAVVGGASALLSIILLATGALAGPERASWDWRVRTLSTPTDATDDVVLVLVDQESLELMSSQNRIDWPWPRSFYGLMVRFLAEAGAASVSIDVILEDQGRFGVADDQQLRAAAAEYGRVTYGAEFFRRGEEGAEPWPQAVDQPALTVDGLTADERAELSFNSASFPHPDVVPRDAVVTAVNQLNDDDGVFRRYRLVNFHEETPVPSLALGPLLFASGDALHLRFDGRRLLVGDTVVPLDNEGKVVLRYTTPGDPTGADGAPLPLHDSFSAFDVVLAGNALTTGSVPGLDPDAFRGKHVFIGLSASGLLDLRPTPLDPRAPGVSVHATMLDNLLAGDFLRDAPLWMTLLWVVGLTVGAAFAATYAERTITEALLIVGFVALAAAAALGAYLADLWLPMVVPMVAAFISIAASNVANYATEGAQKRFISGAFGTYVSPAVVNQLVRNPERLALGGEKRTLTMFFSDIQGFTTLSEGLAPDELSGFLNHYLTALVEIIQSEGGTIDKFEGDAIIAFWNAPLDVPEHPLRGVRAALACQQRLAELRPLYARQKGDSAAAADGVPAVGREIHTRIGLNTAEVSVGNFGSRTRFDYTALGDGMNLAARLEGANKEFGTFVMISRATRELVGDAYPARELGRIAVVGRLEPVTVYEPLTAAARDARAEILDAYGAALSLWYNNRLEEAGERFAAIADHDVPAARMAEKCRQVLADPTVNRSVWNGVVTLSGK